MTGGAGSPRDFYYVRMKRVRRDTRDLLTGQFHRMKWLFQYWMFYPFDDWRNTRHHLRQLHEGDWEFATVGVGAADRTHARPWPIFVGYSHHCFGGWKLFSDPELQTFHGHPVLFVADGSHAVYASPGNPAVKFLHCAVGAGLQSAVNAVDLHDHTVDAADASNAAHAAEQETLGAQTRPVMIWMRRGAPWWRFDSPWGEGEAVNYRGVWYRDADGPLGPAHQGATWSNPIFTILCSGAWTNDNVGNAKGLEPCTNSASPPSARVAARPQ